VEPDVVLHLILERERAGGLVIMHKLSVGEGGAVASGGDVSQGSPHTYIQPLQSWDAVDSVDMK